MSGHLLIYIQEGRGRKKNGELTEMFTDQLSAMQSANNFTTPQPRETTLTFSPQPLSKISQCLPLCGIHVDVFSMTDILIVHNIIVDPLCS